MKIMTNRLGPFRLFAARDVASLLSPLATHVRTENSEHGFFVVFELPEGASIWAQVTEAARVPNAGSKR